MGNNEEVKYVTKEEVEEICVSKLHCQQHQMELLKCITEEKTRNDLQDKDIKLTSESVKEIKDIFKKLIWLIVGLLIEGLWQIIVSLPH